MEVKDYHGYKVFEDTTILGRTGNKLKPYRSGNSLVRVALYYNGGSHCEYLHKIMAECFVPNPNGFTMVRHIDGDVTNNKPSNLEWQDVRIGSILHGKRVIRVDKEGIEKEYISLSQAGRENNCSAANICNYISGRQIDKRGYTWKRKE